MRRHTNTKVALSLVVALSPGPLVSAAYWWVARVLENFGEKPITAITISRRDSRVYRCAILCKRGKLISHIFTLVLAIFRGVERRDNLGISDKPLSLA